jgi:pimeloyl-ACP methyl ester carboxylesterase
VRNVDSHDLLWRLSDSCAIAGRHCRATVIYVERVVDGIDVHYTEHGRGLPLFALHGAGVDHREVEAALESILEGLDGVRRIYPDLPGMGRTAADERLTSNDDVAALLAGFVDQLAPDEPFALLGHSYGAYLARAVAALRRDRCVGLALICPLVDRSGDLPEHRAVRVEGDPYAELVPDDMAGFDEYFVVRTPQLARRYRDSVVPGTRLVDEAGLERIFAGWTLSREPEDLGLVHPALIVAGRQDSTVGFAGAVDLLQHYPRATFAILDGAGHALIHERPDLLAVFVTDWLERVGQRPSPTAEVEPTII